MKTIMNKVIRGTDHETKVRIYRTLNGPITLVISVHELTDKGVKKQCIFRYRSPIKDVSMKAKMAEGISLAKTSINTHREVEANLAET